MYISDTSRLPLASAAGLPTPRRISAACALAAVGSLLCGAHPLHAQATTIISDSFTAADGTLLSLHTPNVDLPGSPYMTTTAGTSIAPTINGNMVTTGSNASASLNLASTKPAVLTLSINLELGSLQVGALGATARGIGLGSFSAAPTGRANITFTGLNVDSTGALSFSSNGALTGPSVAFTGTFSNAALYNLTYSVDTTTGTFTSVIFNGVNDTSAFAGTSAAAFETNNLVGFYGLTAGSSTTADTGFVDNFSVTGVPEPATWLGGALLGLVALLGGAKHLRRAFVF